MYTLITGVDSLVNVQELYERYLIYRGLGNIIDTKRNDNRTKWIMSKNGFADSYASQWVTWQGKRLRMSKFCYESGVLDVVDGVDYFPPDRFEMQHYDPFRERDVINDKGLSFLNAFKPYEVAPWPQPINVGEIEFFLDYVKSVFGETPEKYEYILAWLANLIQSPGNKPRTYPIIVGPQGAGKSFLFEHFVRPILGNNASVTVDDFENLMGNFNSIIEGRVLCVFEEAINHNRKEAASKLKQLVTGDRMLLKKKFEPEREINCFVRPVFISNDEEQAVSIDATVGERRAVVIKVSNRHVGRRKYFTELYEYAHNPDNLAKIHRFLLDYPVNAEVLNTAIVNDEKAAMQTASLIHEAPEVFWIMERLEEGFPLDPLAPREWWQAFVHEDMAELHGNAIVDNAKWPNRVSEAALRNDFQQWCKRHGVSPRKLEGKIKKKVRAVFPHLKPVARIFYNVMLDHKATTVNPILVGFPSRDEVVAHIKEKYPYALSDELKNQVELDSEDLRVKGPTI